VVNMRGRSKSPRKRAAGGGDGVEMVYDPDMVPRVGELLTQPSVAIYYCLAAYFSFGYAASASRSSQGLSFMVARCLPLLYLVAYVLWSRAYSCPTHRCFSQYCVAGLALSCGGEALMQHDPGSFTLVVCLYTCVHICYTGGLYCKYKGSSLAWLIIPLYALLVAAMYVFVTGAVAATVFIAYGVVTMAMAFLAVSRFERERTAPAYLGAAGIHLLMFAHALYALSEFSETFRGKVSPELVTMTSYLAQLGVGMSAHYC